MIIDIKPVATAQKTIALNTDPGITFDQVGVTFDQANTQFGGSDQNNQYIPPITNTIRTT